jgi:hypothetical protein
VAIFAVASIYAPAWHCAGGGDELHLFTVGDTDVYSTYRVMWLLGLAAL